MDGMEAEPGCHSGGPSEARVLTNVVEFAQTATRKYVAVSYYGKAVSVHVHQLPARVGMHRGRRRLSNRGMVR